MNSEVNVDTPNDAHGESNACDERVIEIGGLSEKEPSKPYIRVITEHADDDANHSRTSEKSPEELEFEEKYSVDDAAPMGKLQKAVLIGVIALIVIGAAYVSCYWI